LIETGTIVKGIAGFYYVDTGERVYECKARGVFKNEKLKPAVGDEADIDVADDDTGVIIKIHDRRNIFMRPPVSNVEQFVVVSALADPKPNLPVIDKFLTTAELNNVEIVLCFTKSDLVSEKEIKRMREIYSKVYPVVFLDMTKEESVNDLVPYLFGKKSALAGPSGVGKSTILNALRRNQNTGSEVETGEISEKTKRGRHTTRHVELFKIDCDGLVFDTPGFTSFDAPAVSDDELQELFPEIARYMGKCRFNGCRHINEPDCAVREAVEENEIHIQRYNSYSLQFEEIRERERRKYQ
jgi:ribosome biogenesis GTPase